MAPWTLINAADQTVVWVSGEVLSGRVCRCLRDQSGAKDVLRSSGGLLKAHFMSKPETACRAAAAAVEGESKKKTQFQKKLLNAAC